MSNYNSLTHIGGPKLYNNPSKNPSKNPSNNLYPGSFFHKSQKPPNFNNSKEEENKLPIEEENKLPIIEYFTNSERGIPNVKKNPFVFNKNLWKTGNNPPYWIKNTRKGGKLKKAHKTCKQSRKRRKRTLKNKKKNKITTYKKFLK